MKLDIYREKNEKLDTFLFKFTDSHNDIFRLKQLLEKHTPNNFYIHLNIDELGNSVRKRNLFPYATNSEDIFDRIMVEVIQPTIKEKN